MMENREPQTNQTQFANEEPLYEKASLPVDPDLEEKLASQVSPKRNMRLIGVVAGVSIFLVSLVILLLTSKPRTQAPEQLVKASPSPKTQLTHFEERIADLKAELDEAEPSRDLIPFPPVDLSLRLEK